MADKKSEFENPDPLGKDIIQKISQRTVGGIPSGVAPTKQGQTPEEAMQHALVGPKEWRALQGQRNQQINGSIQMNQMTTEYGDDGLPLEWKQRYATSKEGPNGEPLPPGAHGWTPYGQPDWGPGPAGWFKGQMYKFSELFYGEDDVETDIARIPEQYIGGEKIKETTTKLWDEDKLEWLKYEAGLGLTVLKYFWHRAETTGSSPAALRLIPAVIASTLEGWGLAVNQLARGVEYAIGPSLVAADVLLDRERARSGYTQGWRQWMDEIPVVREGAKLLLSLPLQFTAEGKELRAEYRQAGIWRMAYSAAYDEMAREEFMRKVNAGGDPRLLAMELENPKAELFGQLAFDAATVVGKLTMTMNARKMARIGALTHSTPIDSLANAADDVGRILATDGDAIASAATRTLAVRVQDAIQGVANGLQELGGKRGIRVLTARGKISVHGRRVGDHLNLMAAHFGTKTDDFQRYLHGLALIADPDDAANVARGLGMIADSGAPLKMAFSPAGTEASVLMRKLLFDPATGEIASASKFIAEIGEAGIDIEKFADAVGKKLGDAFEGMFPNVQQQIIQHDEYLRILKEEGEAAAQKYLSKYTQAANEISPLTRAVSSADEVAQKFIYRPASAIQGVLYMGLSPAYRMRNRWTNTFQIFVDQGPGVAIKSLFSPIKAQNEIKSFLGFIPEAAVAGFGPAAGVAGKKVAAGPMHYFSGKAASDEAGAAAYVYADSVRDTMGKAIKSSVADIAEYMPGYSNEQHQLIARLVDRYDGNMDKVVDAVRSMGGAEGYNAARNLMFLSEEDIGKLKSLGLYDDVIAAAMRSETVDEALEAIANVRRNYRTMAEQAAAEGQFIPTDNLTPVAASQLDDIVAAEEGLSRAISKKAGDRASDLMSRQKAATEQALDAIEEKVEELANHATQQIHLAHADEVALGTKTPQQAVDDAAREIDQLMGDTRLRIKTVNGEAIQSGDNLRNTTKALDDLSYGGKSGRELKRLWTEAKLPDMPDEFFVDLTGKQFRRHLWEAYFPKRSANWISRREQIVTLQEIQARKLAAAAGMSAEDIAEIMAKPYEDIALARMFDNATLAPDGTAYVDVGASRLSEIGIEIDEAGDVWRLVKEGETPPPSAVQIKGKYFVKVDPGDVGIRSITPAEIPLDIDVTRKRMGEIDEILRPTVTDEEQIAGRLAGVTGQEPPTTAAKVAAEIPEETRVALEAEREALRLQLEGTETTARMALTAPFDEGAPSQARFAHETRSAAYDALGRVSSGLSDNWGDLRRVTLTPVQEKEMAAWTGAMRERMSVARGVAVGTADNARDFILHDYPKRYGIDTLLGYLYPYQFWYSRTYVKWMKRLISNPALIGRYAKYRQYLEKQHAGLPDWWKYQLNTNELLGLDSEHPLWFNLEQTLSPLYGMTNIDFTDPHKREDWWSSTMEDLNKFGPSVWTPYQLALATAYHAQGKDEAASRWAGRLFSGTRFVRDATAMMGFNEGQGLELDPFIHLYSGGLGPYERARIGRTLSGMVGDGKYSEAEIIDASHSQVGPIWDEAVARAINERAPGNVASFFLGAGFKPRSQNDIQIDRFYSEMYGLIAQRDNYSPDEYSDGWDELRARYPFMDALLLSRKGGLERDEALARNTLSRIPPGATNSIAAMVDIDPDDLGAFYDNKGNLEDMTESDRMRFMAAIIDISAILEVPSNATRSEWNAARDLRRDMLAQGEQMFGGDIWDRVDVFYAKDPEERDAYIKAMPIVEQAMDWQQQMIMSNPFMAAYYTSPERIEKYFKGEMYDEAEEKFGDDLWDHFEVHSRLSDIDNAAARQYWKDHPQLEEYIEFRDAELVEIGKRVDAIGSKIPEAAPPEFREGKVPEGGYQPVDDNEAWIRGQVLSYLGDWEPEAAKEQAQMPPGLNELLSAPGGRELYGLLLDAYYGEELPEIAKRRLEALGISEDYFNQ